jgi:NAD+ kinase
MSKIMSKIKTTPAIRKLLFVTKDGHGKAHELAAHMQDWLLKYDVTSLTLTTTRDTALLRQEAAVADAVCVLGGDGTFLGVARRLVGMNIPVMGINFGRLGFLTEISSADWQIALERLISGQTVILPRLAMAWEVRREGSLVQSGHGVNDVVIGRGSLARVTNLQLGVKYTDNIDNMGWIRTDGLIISTPQGSSAYSLSAGGPLVHPDLNIILVTAISPLLNSLPPLVLPGTGLVRVTVEPGAKDTHLTIDGQEGIDLHGNDEIMAYGVPGGVNIISANKNRYVHTLRERGFIKEFVPEKPARGVGSSGGDGQ